MRYKGYIIFRLEKAIIRPVIRTLNIYILINYKSKQFISHLPNVVSFAAPWRCYVTVIGVHAAYRPRVDYSKAFHQARRRDAKIKGRTSSGDGSRIRHDGGKGREKFTSSRRKRGQSGRSFACLAVPTACYSGSKANQLVLNLLMF